MSSDQPQSERLRVPQPLIKSRIASGRGAMEQPNVTHDGEARLTPRFWFAVVVTGVITGLLGAGLMWLLAAVEQVAYHYHHGSVEAAIAATSQLHRVVTMLLASLIGAPLWFWIRRRFRGECSEIDDALWNGDGELSFRRSALTSVVSEVVIGMGASVGREAAPKLMGGASASVWSHWLRLSPAQKRLLVACGGGAGLAAVYNVPLGGALFTAEVLYGSFALSAVLPALVTSAIATLVGWIYLPHHATYLNVPAFPVTASLTVWSVIAGGVIGLLAVSYIRVIGFVSHYRARGRNIFWMMPLAMGLVGVAGMWYPQLFGNGKEIAQWAFVGGGSWSLLLILLALKPLATSLTLGSGVAGGVFTPFLSVGALAGGLLGTWWLHWWPGSPVGAFAVVGAAAMIGSAMQAPLAGLVLVMEMTHSGFGLMLPLLLATGIATYVARTLDGYSIYSARLPMLEGQH